MRRLTQHRLLARFGLISFVLIAALGVVVGAVLGQSVRNRTVDDAIRTAEIATNLGIKPLIEPEDLQRDFVPLPPQRVAELDDSLAKGLSPDGVVRIKLWNRQHWLVYSDNPRLNGLWFAESDLLGRSFAGEITSEITNLSAPEERSERDFGTLLSVYVPLRVDETGEFSSDGRGDVIGAFEIYLPYEPIASAIRADTQRLYVTLAAGLLILYVALFRLVANASRRIRQQADENRDQAQANLHQATHDALTALPNRVLFGDRLTRAIADARRNDAAATVMLLDLDGFKEINDTLGHVVGDLVVQIVATRLTERVREVDTVARLGGDEFALVFRDVDSPDVALRMANQLVSIVEEPVDIGELDLHISGSIGIATYPTHGANAAELLQHADVAMYAAKAAHAPAEHYDTAIDEYSQERLELASEVRRAIDEGELVLYYQPKLHLASGEINGAEALIRWAHPERGILSPAAFMPVVETTELMGPLTHYVLEAAVSRLRRWLDDGIRLTVAVNLSAWNAIDLGLPRFVADLLAEHGVPAELLELELTESAVLSNPDRAKDVLTQLAGLGCPIAIDDFGTGYASLAYLTELPVHSLKIDQMFVMDIANSGQGAAIVRFSTDLARNLGYSVVAEGVEDLTTLQHLVAYGCDYAQGYFIARPMPEDAFTGWLAASDWPRPEVTKVVKWS